MKNKIEHDEYCIVVRVQTEEALEDFAKIINKPEWAVKSKKRKVIRYSEIKKVNSGNNPFEEFL